MRSTSTTAFMAALTLVAAGLPPTAGISSAETISVAGSVTLVTGEADQPVNGRWRVVGDSAGEWRLLTQPIEGLLPGYYLVEFQDVEGWNTPPPVDVEVNGGLQLTVSSAYTEYPAYPVGDIPPLYVSHGTTFRLYVERAISGSTLSVTASPSPHGDLSFVSNSGLLSYTPDGSDVESFTVTFRESVPGGAQTYQEVQVYPTLNPSRPEYDILKREGNVDPTDDFYLTETYETRLDSDGNAIQEVFNGQMQATRVVTISGIEVIIDSGFSGNHIYNNINCTYTTHAGVDTSSGNDDIHDLSIYCDRLVLRNSIRLPQTNVSIYAREIVFEDVPGRQPASIDTTPLMQKQPDGPPAPGSRNVAPALNGHDGGSIAIFVEKFSVPAGGPVPRLVSNGGRGQNSNPGRDGVKGKYYAVDSGCEPEFRRPGPALIYRESCGGETIYFNPNNLYWGANPSAGNGEDAVPGSRSGNGGSGGTIQSNLDLESYSSTVAGEPGTPDTLKRGGMRGNDGLNQLVLVKTYIGDPCEQEQSHSLHDGANASSTPGTRGADGAFSRSPEQTRWAHPAALRAYLLYAKDLYLNGQLDATREVVSRFLPLLTALTDTPPEDLEDELYQLRSEFEELRYRLDNDLDYFGNPAGWVPTLSFEANLTAWSHEIDQAIPILYATYYLLNKANTREQRIRALSVARANAMTLVADQIAKYTQLQSTVNDLSKDASDIANKIPGKEAQIGARLQALQNDAETNVRNKNRVPGWKRAAGILGNVLKVVPVFQPALAAVGTGLDFVSSVDTNQPIEGIIGDAVDTVSSFNGSTYVELATRFQKNVGVLERQIRDDIRSLPSPGDIDRGDVQASIDKFKGWVNGANEIRKDILPVIGEASKAFKRAEAPADQVQAELASLRASDPEYNDLIDEVQDLLDTKQQLVKEIQAYQDQTNALNNSIMQGMMSIEQFSQDLLAAGQYSHATVEYLKDMEQRTRDRLLKYQYWAAKAYEYRLAVPYAGTFNLNRLFDEFKKLAVEPGDLLSSDAFETILKPAYTESVAQLIFDALDTLNNDAPQIKLIETELDLLPEELDALNSGDPLSLDFGRLGIFSESEEDLRLVNISLQDQDVDFEDVEYTGGRNRRTDIKVEHNGTSIISRGGKFYRFEHYNSTSINPYAWTSKYFHDSNSVTREEPDPAAESLVRALLSTRLPEAKLDEQMLIYARPGAWATFTISKSDNDGVRTRLSKLKFRIKYAKRDLRSGVEAAIDINTALENAASVDPLLPLFVIDSPDTEGRLGGYGSFRRVYRVGGTRTVLAPLHYGRYDFIEWQAVRVHLSQSTNPRITFSVPRDGGRLTAVYRKAQDNPSATPGDFDGDGEVSFSEVVRVVDAFFSRLALTDSELANLGVTDRPQFSDVISVIDGFFGR